MLAIFLAKGGTAIYGIGGKLAADPITGTASMDVPIAISPGHTGFGPWLNPICSSGAGNWPFGFGCSLSLPTITRKTDKGLLQHRNADESDVFILSGMEDLVLAFRQDEDGNCLCAEQGDHLFDEAEWDGYRVRRYRLRVEGLCRIERLTGLQESEVHWRSIPRDKIPSWPGRPYEKWGATSVAFY